MSIEEDMVETPKTITVTADFEPVRATLDVAAKAFQQETLTTSFLAQRLRAGDNRCDVCCCTAGTRVFIINDTERAWICDSAECSAGVVQ